MAKITKITTQKHKGRYNVFLDGHYAFPVGESVLIKFRLAKGEELDSVQIGQIKKSDHDSKAYGAALNYLSYQLRSEKELTDYLRGKDYDANVIDKVMKKLHELQLIDDLAYAKAFVRTEMKTTLDGPRKIERKLKQKKVSSDNIETAIVIFEPKLIFENGTKLAQKVIKQSRNKTYRNTLIKIKQRLLSNGYDRPDGIIDRIIDELDFEPDSQHDEDLLEKKGKKLWPRYEKKDNGKQKFYAAMMRRGFNFSDVRNFLDNLN